MCLCHRLCQSGPDLHREQPCLVCLRLTEQTHSMFLWPDVKSFSQGLLTAASDPNFRNFAVQHRWHEHSEAALVSLLRACVGPKTTRLLNAVLSCLEDLELIITRLQPALPALPALETHYQMPSARAPELANGIGPGVVHATRRHSRCLHRRQRQLQSRAQTGASPPGRAWPSTLRLSRKALPLQSVPFRGPFLGRTGAFLLRQVHGLLAWKPHKAFLFVDDLLCALFRDSAPDMFALVVLFFCAIAAPISWKKAQFQDSLVWCGWEINFSHDIIQAGLLGNRRVPRKTVEQCIGLLIWAALPCISDPG